MNKRYLLLAGIVIILGIGILFMPQTGDNKQIKPELLLTAIDDPSRFLTTDDITDRIVKQDPALLLIDVRPSAQYKAFSIPGAINIPLDSLLTISAQDQLKQNGMDKVFYSNSDVMSDQAWILCKRVGLGRIYVMQGGVNKWFNTIVKAEKPGETEPVQDMELYQFRMAACQHFFGNAASAGPAMENSPKKEVKVVKKPAAASSGGGC
jgi:sulfur-carrier protein adenylyltransferase/sulfurtransferase